ncbi:MAG: glycosyl transferase family 2 [Bacteroidetes bacterium HGW-Bacteroidetes-9]|nr:MAG: glycosyl transferase family 2 [Bacteroidetes bacterium HGW-Bacteroidetes-9]
MDWLHGILSSEWFVLIIILMAALFIQLIYFWFVFSKLAFYNAAKRPVSDVKEPVSVIICAKNEYHNLVRFLPQMLEQDYPEYEVVVVNDASDDDTYYLLRELSDKHPRLSVVNISQNLNFFKGKKFPLSIGIKSAKYDLVLLADADCSPAGPDWISSMQSAFTGKTEIVLGYGPYTPQPGLLNKLIRFDTLMVAIQYMSFSLSGMPYMGVGRNLAYKKSLFFQVGGFVKHYRISSGDDDLFINQVAKKSNTRIQVEAASYTYSKSKQTLASWYRQKKRHLTTGSLYRFGHKFVLGIYSLSQILFFGLLIALAILGVDWKLLSGIFGLRLITQLIIVKKSMIRLNEKHFFLLSPLFEIWLMLINLLLGIRGVFSKKTQW